MSTTPQNEKTTALTKKQQNCPHPNPRVTAMTPPNPRNGDKRIIMMVCDGCNVPLYRVGSSSSSSGDDEAPHVIDTGCVECDSKGKSSNTSITTTVMDDDNEPVAPEKHPVNISGGRGTMTDIIISHDINDPKFQRYPQYSPDYPPKDGEVVDKRGNPVVSKRKNP